jgi:ArsR family transcriptional regulator
MDPDVTVASVPARRAGVDRCTPATIDNWMVWYGQPMATLVISPRERGCCSSPAEPTIGHDAAARLAAVGKALGDPTRVLIVDALRAAAPEAVCQCELLPLFDMSQPALAKHLKVLVAAGIIGTERRGLWAYYFHLPDAFEELRTWMS